MAPRALDITGNRYGSITVLGRAPTPAHKNPHARWHVRCDCGKEWEVDGSYLRRKQKACSSCAVAKVRNVGLNLNWTRIRNLRARGHSWEAIAKRLGTSDTTLKHWRREEDGRMCWIRVNFDRITAMLDEGRDWKAIAAKVDAKFGNPLNLCSLYTYWVNRTVAEELQMWVQSPHGRVTKALAEGYSVGPGCERANVAGSTWHQLAARALPAYVAWMLALPKERIAAWLNRGATWREINEFLDKPFRFGAVTEACYHARCDWDAALERRVVEDDMAA